MPEVGAGIRRQVVVGEAAADVDGDRGVRHTVVERRSVRVAVEVHGVLLEQVGAHDHADVGQREEELIVLVDRHQRRRYVAVHDADIHDRPWIDVAVQLAGRYGFRVRDEADCAVEARHERIADCRRITDHVEHRCRLSARQAGTNVGKARQRAEGEHIGLGAVGHRRVAIATRDLLALDPAADRIGIGVDRCRRMQRGRRGALNAEARSPCVHGKNTQQQCEQQPFEVGKVQHGVISFPLVGAWRPGENKSRFS